MRIRKIQQTPSGTFFVCLPKDWARRHRLTRGAPVAVKETPDGKLVIDAQYTVKRIPQQVVIRPTPLLDREILEKYLLGYDIVEVAAKEGIRPRDHERIRKAISQLIGMEIVEEDYSRVVMQCLLEPAALSPERVLRREYSIVSGMHRDAVMAFVEGNVQLAKHVVERDNDVNRLYFLLVRILRSIIQRPDLGEKLGLLPIDCLDYRLIASLVEKIGDQSAQIAETVVKLKNASIKMEVSQLISDLHRLAYDSHEMAMEAFLTRNIELAEAVRAKEEEFMSLFRKVEVAAHTQPIELASHLILIATAISQIYGHSVDIADLVMPKLV